MIRRLNRWCTVWILWLYESTTKFGRKRANIPVIFRMLRLRFNFQDHRNNIAAIRPETHSPFRLPSTTTCAWQTKSMSSIFPPTETADTARDAHDMVVIKLHSNKRMHIAALDSFVFLFFSVLHNEPSLSLASGASTPHPCCCLIPTWLFQVYINKPCHPKSRV